MTSSNAESVKSNASILSVEDAHDDQLEPPSKKIRSETPTQELAKVINYFLSNFDNKTMELEQ